MGTEKTKGRTPTIDGWIAGTTEAYRRGIWDRPGGLVYAGHDELLAQHGQRFTYERSRAMPDDVIEGQLGECYKNAGANVGGAYRYVEGYAMTSGGIMPVRHAWLIDADDNVIDPTWPADLEAIHGDEDGEREYFGLVFPDALYFEIVQRRKVWGVLDDRELYLREWQGEY